MKQSQKDVVSLALVDRGADHFSLSEVEQIVDELVSIGVDDVPRLMTIGASVLEIAYLSELPFDELVGRLFGTVGEVGV